MKKTVSAVIAVITVIVSLFAFASCGNGGKKTVAIIQFGSHASLNNCYDGVIAGLKENGIDLDKYDVKYVNSNFDPSVSQSQAQSFVNGKAEIIIAIATPSAVAAATAAEGEIPVVYCAITDGSVMSNYENVTGSSDVPDFEKQLPMGQFARCHNSYLVNLDEVREIGRTELSLQSGETLPMGRTYYKAFQSAFVWYINQ